MLRCHPTLHSHGSSDSQIGAVLNNFTDSLAAAEKLDAKLASDGGAISSEYADLLTLATRQTFGAIDLTVARPNPGGEVNMSDVKAFAKDFGSVGSGGCVISFRC